LLWTAFLLLSVALAGATGGDAGVSSKGQTRPPDLTGRVVDAEGRPMAGVKVWTRQTEEDVRQGREPQPMAITGPDGRFVVRGGVRAFDQVAVCPTGWAYEQKQLRGFPPFLPFELRLHKATRITGRVVDKGGDPVAGIRVWALLEGRSGGCIRYGAIPPCENSSEPRSGLTNAEGGFVFESLEPGWYEVSVAETEQGDQQVVRREGAAGRGIEGIEFILSRKSVPVDGRVVDADGAPVIGAQVTLSRAMPQPDTTTDATGTFHFSGVLSGESHLEVSHEDHGWLAKDIAIADRPVRLDLQMPSGTPVQGRILGPDGSPVDKVFLKDGEQYIDVAADGSFRFIAPPGEQDISVHSFDPEGTAQERFLAEGKPIDLELRLARPGTVKIRLTGLPPGEEGRIDLSERLLLFQDDFDHGLHTLTGLPPGTWTLMAKDDNGRTFERQVEVREGEETDAGEIHFPPLPAVRGRVLDPAGRPAAEAEITFRHGDQEILADTDSAGRFVTWLREGFWSFAAGQDGCGPAIGAIEIPGDTPVELPDLKLSRLVTLTGRLLGVPPEVVVAAVVAHNEDSMESITIPLTPEHRFSSTDLWPGTWTLSTDVDGRLVSTTLQILQGAADAQVELNVADSEIKP
jgi:protocatechuate 3,4-dioxygenase beta subunit